MRDPACRAGITGMAAVSVLGRGAHAQLAGGLAGTAQFAPVRRFDVDRRRVTVAAPLPDAGSLGDELARVVRDACAQAGLTGEQAASTPLLLAVHGHPAAGRQSEVDSAAAFAAELAERTGLGGGHRVYTRACVSASTSVADAAALMGLGRADRVVVAAGYLVEPDQFALFDAGRALATDGAARPLSAGRGGLPLGDAVSAAVLEAGAREPLAAGIGRRA